MLVQLVGCGGLRTEQPDERTRRAQDQVEQQADFDRGVAHFAEEPIDGPWAAETKQLLEQHLLQPLASISGLVVQPIECRDHTCVLEFHADDSEQIDKAIRVVRPAVRKLQVAGQPISHALSTGSSTTDDDDARTGRFYFTFVRSEREPSAD
jgi:hypothetical protein